MKNKPLLFAAINSFLITQFLFFIDEGYYDLQWMSSIGNWLLFVVYFAMLTGILYIINFGLTKISTNKYLVFGINLIIFPLLLITIFANL
jgi:hypothetical protein